MAAEPDGPGTVRFLSDRWIAALGDALETGVPADGGRPPLVIQQLVDHADGTISAYQIRLDAGGATAGAGVAEDATVTYRQSYEVALGIARGELDAHVEFLIGRVVISGNSEALVQHRSALAAVSKALADLPEITEF